MLLRAWGPMVLFNFTDPSPTAVKKASNLLWNSMSTFLSLLKSSTISLQLEIPAFQKLHNCCQYGLCGVSFLFQSFSSSLLVLSALTCKAYILFEVPYSLEQAFGFCNSSIPLTSANSFSCASFCLGICNCIAV